MEDKEKNIFDQIVNGAKKIGKKFLKASIVKKVLLSIIVFAIILTVLASTKYVVVKDEAVNDPSNPKNVPGRVEGYNEAINMDDSANITRDKTPQELWDEMIKAGANVDDYLDSPEELMKLVNAEFVTKYMDTREDPTAEIDWENINDINSKSIQGIVKLKRDNEVDEAKNLTYVDKNIFDAYINEYNSTGSDTAKNNAMSHFTIAKKNTSGNSEESDNTESVVKVAIFNKNTKTIESTDPNVQNSNTVTYNMTTKDIDYQSIVKNYTLPFDYIWAWLVLTEDKDFAMKLADMAYESDIEITVFDNQSNTKSVNVETYTVKEDIDITGKIKVYSITVGTGLENSVKSWDREAFNDYMVTETNVLETTTFDAYVTKANVWFGNYVKEFKRTNDDPIENESNEELSDEIVEENVKLENKDRFNLVTTYLNERIAVHGDISSNLGVIGGEIVYKNEIVTSSKINRMSNTTTTINKTSWEEVPSTTETEDGYDIENGKFVTLYKSREASTARNVMETASSWLFDILESNESTAEMVDLTKYLLYKATNIDYGVTEFNISEYRIDGMQMVGSGVLYGNTLEEKIWVAFIGEGYSEYATAGVLGNIYKESGFNLEAVNSIGASGMCQWLGGRKNGLMNYADSLGKEWTEASVQIEYLIGEITPGGGADGYATYNHYKYEEWKNADSPEAAAEAFCWGFERPGRHEADIPTRKQKAREYYEKFKGKSAADFMVGTGEYPYYNQYDEKYKNKPFGTSTIGTSGCGPTSLSMIVSGLLGDPSIDPVRIVSDLADYFPNGAYVSGVGASHVMFQNEFLSAKYGLTAQYGITEQEGLNALAQGYPVIGGVPGHILAYIPVTPEQRAQGYIFQLSDPAVWRNSKLLVKSVEEAEAAVNRGSFRFLSIIRP